jgi:hypothetical protein
MIPDKLKEAAAEVVRCNHAVTRIESSPYGAGIIEAQAIYKVEYDIAKQKLNVATAEYNQILSDYFCDNKII